MEIKEINKMLKDKNISDKLRLELEKRKDILLNNKTITK
jgi:hypothetical protein